MNGDLILKNNYDLLLSLYDILDKTSPVIENILALFEYKDTKKPSSDMIAFKPLNLETVKAVNIIHHASNERKVSSVITKLLNNSLDLARISKVFGKYTVYENGRDVSYQIVFNYLESKNLASVALYTLPMQYTDNLENLLLTSSSWIDSVEFVFN
jgi:hypothetical protein